jgi:sulfur-carrier protein adenylyltransferase/sulfurtransferase
MEGGINAWKGLVAEGPPESGMAYFSAATKTEELIALAWLLEDGSRKFYSQISALSEDGEARDLYRDLAEAEERHKDSLLKLFKEFSGPKSEQEFPASVISVEKEGDVMEGGVLVGEALEWAKGKKVREVLDFSLSAETNSFDLYVKMERHVKDKQSARVFYLLSGEEKEHLQRLSSLLEKKV